MQGFNSNLFLTPPVQAVSPAAPVSLANMAQPIAAEMERRKRGCKFGARRHGRCPSRRSRR